MKQITYNSSAHVLKLEIPAEWSAEDLTGVTVQVKDVDGVSLLDATAVTMYTPTTLDGAVSKYSNEITLADTADDVAIRDALDLVGAGGKETVRVKGYDSTTKIATLEDITRNDYDDGDSVYGLFGTYSLDTSDTDVFKLGAQLTVLWTPSGTGQQTRELYQVAKSVSDMIDLRRRFSDLYPRAYDAFTAPTERFESMVFEAEEAIKAEMASDLMNYDRIVDQSIVSIALMAKMAFLWTWNGDVEIEDERNFLELQYDKAYKRITDLPIWQDSNQDDVVDEEEVTSHTPFFERGW